MPMSRHKKSVLLAALAALSLVACSREGGSVSDGSAAVASKGATTVLIERETRWDDPQAYVQAIRSVIEDCRNARAQAGSADGEATRGGSLSDAEILALETTFTQEAFDGVRHAQVRTVTAIDRGRWGPGPGESCRPVATRTRSVTIHPDACSSVEVVYDPQLPGGGSRRQESGACMPAAPAADPAAMAGERMAIAGTALHCRWTAPEGSPGRLCLLEPWLKYPGSDRDLVVEARRFAPAHPVASVQAAQQAARSSERAIRVEVGKSLPAGIFEVPADARGFGDAGR
ncbi:Uncharacterised protein [Delftia tsuruhatensis]|uniref:hypothetical protein n=1 Tax=Delftia tsuruhatensis TaxID=180282 RepID=UPI001E7EC1C3|nr:hypothetical protein [Delftia tsuruhatensis]CAB5691775.1 Uncharacterised protein [Delftia tsuruhatensis]CAC9676842.1 Uncharacterised protein [Delftia tsuruhatensis]